MIGEGKFRANLDEGFKLLQQLSLVATRNYFPAIDEVTTDLIRSSTTYAETYNRYLTRQAYDFLLDDGSIFFFRRRSADPTLLSYGFLESPYRGVSYRQFVAEFRQDEEEGEGEGEAEDNATWQQYEEYCAQRPQRRHILPIRYDWSPVLYREAAHPAAHLHLGFESDMRLAVDATLLPLQFVLFVIRHYYVKTWEETASHLDDVVRAAQSISDSDVVPEYRRMRDHLELRLISLRCLRDDAHTKGSGTRHRS